MKTLDTSVGFFPDDPTIHTIHFHSKCQCQHHASSQVTYCNLLAKSYVHVSTGHSSKAHINSWHTISRSLYTLAGISGSSWCQRFLNRLPAHVERSFGCKGYVDGPASHRHVLLWSPCLSLWISLLYQLELLQGGDNFFNTKLTVWLAFVGPKKTQIQERRCNMQSQYLLHALPWDRVATFWENWAVETFRLFIWVHRYQNAILSFHKSREQLCGWKKMSPEPPLTQWWAENE